MQQSEIIRFLEMPQTHGLPEGTVIERFDTHISIVICAGNFAYKLKRAIELPFVDFRHLEDRRKFCAKELEVNQLGAAILYEDIVAVTQEEDGALALNGDGEPVEWLVRMLRFNQADLFDHLCETDQLSLTDMDRLTDLVIDCYSDAKRDFTYGGDDGITRAFDGHYKAIKACAPHILDQDKVAQLKTLVATHLKRTAPLLKDRRDIGFVRHCHGDLHLRNICFFRGRTTIFDAIEFEPDFAIIDVLYDLSFLLMDLCHRGRQDLANAVMNRYVGRSGDLAGMSLLNLFLSSRATIRTHVNARASENQQDEATRKRWEAESREYLDEAVDYLQKKPSMLIAIGGLSGSGKSVLARKLAPQLGVKPGAYIARTDMIRKRIMGARPEDKLSNYAYSASVTSHTYNTLYVDTRMAVGAGHCVVADGVFAKQSEREALEKLAHDLEIPFVGLWLEAPQDLLEQRVEGRKNDPSDATEEIVKMQSGFDLGDVAWQRLDASQGIENVYEKAMDYIKEQVDFSCFSGK